jgi:hypothetical protein
MTQDITHKLVESSGSLAAVQQIDERVGGTRDLPASRPRHFSRRVRGAQASPLLAEVIDAHGGMDRWNAYKEVEASIVSGGGFFALKGLIQDPDPRRTKVWLHEQRASVQPYGSPDQCTAFTSDRIATEKVDGTVVAERLAPTDSFAGHQMHTPWDELRRAYFNGEALWTYLTTPFVLTAAGVHVEETEPWQQDGQTWRVLRARFPGSIETHSRVQDFFFDDSRMLRRHDYQVNIAGGFPASQLTSEHVTVRGITLPTKRRAYTRGPDRRPILDMLMVAIDFSDIRFS